MFDPCPHPEFVSASFTGNLSDVTVAILAGGMGTRLKSAVSDRPKVMAEVAGRPFLAWWLDRLENYGFRRAVLCTGYQAEQMRTCFGTTHGQLALIHSPESSPLGTGGALRLALPYCETNHLLVINGDSFCEVDLLMFTDWHLRRRNTGSLALTQVTDTRRYGRVEVKPDGRIIHFAEKNETRGPGWINAGIYLFRRRLVEAIPDGRFVSLERDLLPGWLPGGDIYGFRKAARFIDIGTPESYSQAGAFFAEMMAAA